MAKGYRGKNIRTTGWRDTCPICKRKRVKVLWPGTDDKGNEIKICKICNKKDGE